MQIDSNSDSSSSLVDLCINHLIHKQIPSIVLIDPHGPRRKDIAQRYFLSEDSIPFDLYEIYREKKRQYENSHIAPIAKCIVTIEHLHQLNWSGMHYYQLPIINCQTKLRNTHDMMPFLEPWRVDICRHINHVFKPNKLFSDIELLMYDDFEMNGSEYLAEVTLRLVNKLKEYLDTLNRLDVATWANYTYPGY